MTTKDEIAKDAVAESKDRRGRALLVVLGVIALALLVLAGAMFYFAYTNTRDQAEAGTNLAQQIEKACEDPARTAGDLGRLCDDAEQVVEEGEAVGIVGPQGPKGDPGAPGTPGPPPSDAQVANAVALYCSGGRCRGSNGENATPAQVAEAVAAYCNDRGQCRGPAGAPGQDGQDGAPGPQGPPPTAEQVAAAVATYCSSRNECQGPPGPQGPPGEDGETVTIDSSCEDQDRPVESIDVTGNPQEGFTIVCSRGEYFAPGNEGTPNG